MRAGPLLFKSLVLTGSLLQAAASHAAVVSNITGDGTLGTAISRSGNVYGINGGTIRGSNQFHSFGAFTVGTGDVASFNGPPVIANILGRVTGGQQSVIDGILRSTIGGANLFLLNPSGVLFGPNASLDLTGAFHVSTADYLRLADGAKFFANLSKDSVLTAAPPAAFGFLGPAAASITIQGSTLAVPEGQMLSVVGGDIQITGATLVAPSGRIQIASVASAGEAVLNGPGGPPGLDVSSFPRLGQIEISTSLIDASDLSGFGGGTVFIRGGRLVVDASTIRSDTFGDLDGAQPGIDLGARDDMILTNATSIGTATFGGGRGGDVQVAAGSLQMDGTGTAIRTSTDFFALGNAGDVSVTAGAVTLTNGAVIGSLSLSALGGRGGAVTVNAPDGSISISGRDAFGTPGGILAC